MRTKHYKVCSNCGNEQSRGYHCLKCNALGREKRIKFTFRIGWRRPRIGEYEGVPLHERELIKDPPEPPFSER